MSFVRTCKFELHWLHHRISYDPVSLEKYAAFLNVILYKCKTTLCDREKENLEDVRSVRVGHKKR
jgi:hypothetical protein